MLAHILWWFMLFDISMQYHDKMLGPSDFTFKLMKVCEDFETVVNFAISQKKHNRTTNVLDIRVASADFEIGDNLVVELKGSLKKDGGYKPGAYYVKDVVCKLLQKVVGEIADDIFAAAGIEGCPIPRGEYAALNYYFDNTKFTVPQVFGEYKMDINVFKDDVLVGCFVAFYDLMDKRQ
ncbi:hypothetical protein ABMA28_004645 [Loxostege sticticalis]|uniref:MD-2-related lipid-recognition domain-containing protein n=1 Tax=Loxostege sticticalis TaxID=481309 RepID=A0ABD0SRY1_LOXSC